MGDTRLIDETGLHGAATLLETAATDLTASGYRALSALDSVSRSRGSVGSVFLVATALDVSVRDLRIRQVFRPPNGPSCPLPSPQIDPSPVNVHGIEDSSEAWQWGAPHDKDDDWIHATLIEGEWGGQVAVRQEDYRGPLGTFSASALAAEAQARTWVGVDDFGIELGGIAEVGVFLAQAEYGLDTRYLDLESEVFVGGEVSVAGDLDLNIFNGDAGFAGGVDAFVGMAAAAEAGIGPESLQVVAGGEVGIGVGIDADVTGTFDDGVLSFEFGASAFLGLGGGFDLGLEIDLGAIGSATVDVFSWAAEGLSSLWN